MFLVMKLNHFLTWTFKRSNQKYQNKQEEVKEKQVRNEGGKDEKEEDEQDNQEEEKEEQLKCPTWRWERISAELYWQETFPQPLQRHL